MFDTFFVFSSSSSLKHMKVCVLSFCERRAVRSLIVCFEFVDVIGRALERSKVLSETTWFLWSNKIVNRHEWVVHNNVYIIVCWSVGDDSTLDERSLGLANPNIIKITTPWRTPKVALHWFVQSQSSSTKPFLCDDDETDHIGRHTQSVAVIREFPPSQKSGAPGETFPMRPMPTVERTHRWICWKPQ